MYVIINITDKLIKNNRYYNKNISFYDKSKLNKFITLKPGERYNLNTKEIDRSVQRLRNLNYINIININKDTINLNTNVKSDNNLINKVENITDITSKVDINSNLNLHKDNLVDYISIIIPTYNNVEYIDECIDSIIINKSEYLNIEIIIGIDNCEKTKNHIQSKRNKFNNINIKFVYFNQNVGPYIIKNTLVNYAMYNNIIFFDSDDIFYSGKIKKIALSLRDNMHVIFKHNEFNNKNSIYNNIIKFGEGVIGISKKIFIELNGYQPWRCAADTEFRERYISKYKILFKLNEIVFNRRLHDKSLTKNKDTGYNSEIRKKYRKQIEENKKNKYPNPDKLYIENNHYII